MAAEKTAQKCALQLKLEVGTTSGGAAKYSTKTLSDVSTSASDQDILDVGTSLSNLQNYPLGSVMRRDTATIVDDGD